MKDKRLNAIITLADDWLPSLDVKERRQFLRELRCGWCETCGHTESQVCRDGACYEYYKVGEQ